MRCGAQWPVMSSASAALSELQQLTAVLEAEKKAAAALQKTLDDRESVVSAAQKQVVALRADVEAESKARVQLQIDVRAPPRARATHCTRRSSVACRH